MRKVQKNHRYYPNASSWVRFTLKCWNTIETSEKQAKCLKMVLLMRKGRKTPTFEPNRLSSLVEVPSTINMLESWKNVPKSATNFRLAYKWLKKVRKTYQNRQNSKYNQKSSNYTNRYHQVLWTSWNVPTHVLTLIFWPKTQFFLCKVASFILSTPCSSNGAAILWVWASSEH